MDDLLAQLDAKDGAAQQEAHTILTEVAVQKATEVADRPKNDSRTRHQARQARKAALLAEQYAHSNNPEADARLEQEARDEERIITKTCEELGVRMFEISPDGHCLFSAIGDQLAVLGLIAHSQTSYPTIRQAAADYIEAHPDDFIPFLPMESEDSADSGLMSPEEFKDYCAKVRETAVWGGEPEIMALANAYKVPIHVIQAATPHIVVHNPSDQVPLDDSKILRISYHRRMYGLGEHYNSLRPKRAMGFAEGFKSIFTASSPPP
ncbi:hypothetical protein PHLGIDRAFT_68237 [Phlebiopsis gigantea 11061_1 CR5-6]|uniref:OTU domain-containing protein n=1 Tax=Phlebiopsis gigantea (strain 11061_1 CR5-6) TaxID=745531 RepID=A0A0C3PPZ9_PHLG1|nr:hypothetical protein PHLGIDRAFT_68237 [Phlebiopsis gigantea 11061_1 CR5-6]